MPGLRLLPRFVLLLPLAVAFSLAQTSESAKHGNQTIKPVIHLEDIARQAGLGMLNVSGGDTHKEFIIETTGNGALMIDYDDDGWPDIYLPNGSTVESLPKDQAPTGHLYHNNHDGTFSDVTLRAGVARAGWGQGG